MTRPRPVRAVLFDLDGTLVDSEIHTDQAISAALAQYGIADFRLPHTETQGRTWIYIADNIRARTNIDRAVPRNRRRPAGEMERRCNGREADSRRTGSRAHRGGAQSETRRRLVEPALRDRLFSRQARRRRLHRPRARIGGDAVSNTKPDPEGYLLAARALGVDPADAAGV